MDFGAFTDVGKVRKENQDSLYIPEKGDFPVLFLVSDGIGGQNFGQLAGQMTINNMVDYIKKNREEYNNKTELLKNASIYANNEINNFASKDIKYYGMGATLVALLIEENLAHITHAGDSRCYIIRNKIISQLTVDNSYVEYLLQKGAISADEAKNHPQKNLITKAIGMEEKLDIEIDTIEIKSGDIFLLCSDGLTTMLSDEDILYIVLSKKSKMQTIARQLVKSANEKGGRDNITAILLEV